MGFYEVLKEYKDLNFAKLIKDVEEKDVIKVLEKDRLSAEDYLILLSPKAEKHLEEMAHLAHQLTVKNFGKVIFLYAPLYLADYCVNNCAYCGFSVNNDYKRKKLTMDEVRREASSVAKKGIRDILILTGESRKHTPVDYIKNCVEVLKEYFSSITIEIYPLTTEEYRELVEADVEGLTIYQEVYDEDIYDQVHLSGPKKNYLFRLNAPERGCRAGIRRVNIGPLLGLDDWRREVFFAGLHAEYLQRKYLDMEISISFPRLMPHPGNFDSGIVVKDKHLVQIILAYRLFLPRVGINLSTRESAVFRDNLIPLGITKMSAGSTTVVGGYTEKSGNVQFEIADNRSVTDIKRLLSGKGYQAVFKDWYQI